jgi:hypothetical protein
MLKVQARASDVQLELDHEALYDAAAGPLVLQVEEGQARLRILQAARGDVPLRHLKRSAWAARVLVRACGVDRVLAAFDFFRVGAAAQLGIDRLAFVVRRWEELVRRARRGQERLIKLARDLDALLEAEGPSPTLEAVIEGATELGEVLHRVADRKAATK